MKVFIYLLIMMFLPKVFAADRYMIQVGDNFNLESFVESNETIDVVEYFPRLQMLLINLPENRSMPQSLLVKNIEPDQMFYPIAVQQNPSWGLDRIDQRLGLDRLYKYETTKQKVNVYVVDTGIRLDHIDFKDRLLPGYSAIGGDTNDCAGHGTHVAGTIGGSWSGVAKNVKLHPIRVFGCNGGTAMSTIARGLDWILENVEYPAVVNLSLGGNFSSMLNAAVEKLYEANINVVVAAGNSNANACNYSPASSKYAITVGATTKQDARASYSNYGPCIDLWAPGSDIRSAYNNAPNGAAVLSGTSMASPHVAGVVALYLQHKPHATSQEVFEEIVIKRSTQGIVSFVGNSTNFFLHSDFSDLKQ